MYNTQIPASVSVPETRALNDTHIYMLDRLQLQRLIVSFQNESDEDKLLLWLETFGIPEALVDFPFEPNEVKLMIECLNRIKVVSGTMESVKLCAEALGATNVVVSRVTDYILYADGLTVGTFGDDNLNTNSIHAGTYYCDAAAWNNRYLVDVMISFYGDFNDFKNRFKMLFKALQPIRICVRKIEKI